MTALRLTGLFVGISLLTGCATSGHTYTAPVDHKFEITKTVQKDFETVWTQLIEGLTSSFFVINNVEKDSGFINVSYFSPDPRDIIDGGTANFWIKVAFSTKNFNVELAQPTANYQVVVAGVVGNVYRKATCEGRINITVQRVNEHATRVNVNVKYVPVISGEVKYPRYTGNGTIIITEPFSFVFSFTSKTRGTGESLGEYISTGKIESEILGLF